MARKAGVAPQQIHNIGIMADTPPDTAAWLLERTAARLRAQAERLRTQAGKYAALAEELTSNE